MVEIHWLDGVLAVRRLVLCENTPIYLANTVHQLAAAHGLVISNERSAAERGDLWIGCQPRTGWGEVATTEIGWVRGPEIYLAIAQLRHAKSSWSSDDGSTGVSGSVVVASTKSPVRQFRNVHADAARSCS